MLFYMIPTQKLRGPAKDRRAPLGREPEQHHIWPQACPASDGATQILKKTIEIAIVIRQGFLLKGAERLAIL